MRVLITGAGGMLADALAFHCDLKKDEVFGIFLHPEDAERHKARFPHRSIIELGRSIPDSTSFERVQRWVENSKPDWIFHLAAWTDVDGCESNFERAFRFNTLATYDVALVARNLNVPVMYLSSDYVFDGSSSVPYRETDSTRPLSMYARTKWIGEQLIQENARHFVIVRSAWLFGPLGKNFVDTIRGRLQSNEPVRVVNDQRGSPTYTLSLAIALRGLAEQNKRGVFHAANRGNASWYELALAIGRFLGKESLVSPTSTEAIGRPAPRPAYSVLDVSKLESEAKIVLPHWTDDLKKHLDMVAHPHGPSTKA